MWIYDRRFVSLAVFYDSGYIEDQYSRRPETMQVLKINKYISSNLYIDKNLISISLI